MNGSDSPARPPRFPAPLISAAELAAALAAAPAPVLIDTRFDLADPAAGERSYHADGHLPGAHYLHLDRDLCAPKTGRNGRHPLPPRGSFAATAGALGIGPATPVVVMDAQQGTYAARAWWMLRWLGHRAVALLDGGVQAWQAAGGALVREVPARPGGAPYPLATPTVEPVDAAALLDRLGRVRLIDARAPERYRGEVEPLDARAGHIPGAVNRFFRDNLAADGRFLPPAALREAFARLGVAPGAEVVHQCGSGVTACHNALAMELAGLGTGALYPGSWSEWSSDPARPVATG